MRRFERTRAWALAALLVGFSALLAHTLLGLVGLFITGGLMAVALATARSGDVVLRLHGAQAVPRASLVTLQAVTHRLASLAGLPHSPRLFWIDSPTPTALATETADGRGAVAVTRGLLALLPPSEVEAVVAHEVSHLAHGDTRITRVVAAALSGTRLVLQIAAMLAMVLLLASGQGWTQVLLLLAAGLVVPLGLAAVQSAMARAHEFSADAGAAQLIGGPNSLASALLRIEQRVRRPTRWFAWRSKPDPTLSGLFDTHPPTHERIARLLRASS